MKKIFFFFALVGLLATANIHAQEGGQNMHETGRSFMRQGDFDNSILVLTRALQQDPKNVDIRKDLVMSHFLKRDYAKAKEQVEPLIENDNADEVAYQIAGNIYKALEEVKSADR